MEQLEMFLAALGEAAERFSECFSKLFGAVQCETPHKEKITQCTQYRMPVYNPNVKRPRLHQYRRI